MADIPVPKLPVGHPDRLLHCEELLEDAFFDLATRAEAAGWGATEISLALLSLAENRILGLGENAKTNAAIAEAKAKAKSRLQ